MPTINNTVTLELNALQHANLTAAFYRICLANKVYAIDDTSVPTFGINHSKMGIDTTPMMVYMSEYPNHFVSTTVDGENAMCLISPKEANDGKKTTVKLTIVGSPNYLMQQIVEGHLGYEYLAPFLNVESTLTRVGVEPNKITLMN